MNADDVRTAVLSAIEAVAPEVDPGDLDPGEEIWYGLDLDSMDQLQIMERLAQATGVQIPEVDYPKLQSIDDLVAYCAAAASTAN